MYKDFFGLSEAPFSIVPKRRFLFESARHQEALRHLQAGLSTGGGLAMLTGEVGTGKTLVAKSLLAGLGEDVCSGLLLNPTYSETDLLEAICDEFSVDYKQGASLKELSQAITAFLTRMQHQQRQVLLVIDEAQHLSPLVLEQLRLLTNLESEHEKLLKVLLVGQPELQHKLQTPQLRQLAQRITGRYHLLPLTREEVSNYIAFRTKTAGADQPLFSASACQVAAKASQGVPRLINLICDRALHLAFHSSARLVDKGLMSRAADEVMDFQYRPEAPQKAGISPVWPGAAAGIALSLLSWFMLPQALESQWPVQAQQISGTQEITPEQVLQPLLAQSQDELKSMQQLYALWGLKASAWQAACQPGSESSYRCDRASGSLDDVQRFDRPVQFQFSFGGETVNAVLYRLTTSHAELLLGDKSAEVERSWLDAHWPGEYRYLWHSPVISVLKPGTRGEEVQLLGQALAKAFGEQVSDSDRFDSALEQKVRAFQGWQGLSVDGVAGRKTLMALDRLTNGQAPVLNPSSFQASFQVSSQAVEAEL